MESSNVAATRMKRLKSFGKEFQPKKIMKEIIIISSSSEEDVDEKTLMTVNDEYEDDMEKLPKRDFIKLEKEFCVGNAVIECKVERCTGSVCLLDLINIKNFICNGWDGIDEEALKSLLLQHSDLLESISLISQDQFQIFRESYNPIPERQRKCLLMER